MAPILIRKEPLMSKHGLPIVRLIDMFGREALEDVMGLEGTPKVGHEKIRMPGELKNGIKPAHLFERVFLLSRYEFQDLQAICAAEPFSFRESVKRIDPFFTTLNLNRPVPRARVISMDDHHIRFVPQQLLVSW